MTSFIDTANLIMQVGQQRRQQQAQDQAQFYSAMNQLAGAAQQAMAAREANQAANQVSDQLDPRGQLGGEPVTDWRRHSQGDFVDHTGGTQELQRIRAWSADPMAAAMADRRMQGLADKMQMDRDLSHRRMETALNSNSVAPPGGHGIVRQNNTTYQWNGAEYLPV